MSSVLDFEQRWISYSEAENEPEVVPIVIVQVPDKASEEKLAELVSVIESDWAGLAPDAVAHVFGEHDAIQLPTRTLRWVPPESIQDDRDVRVVLAKEAISTGWDCPRAEVLCSERLTSHGDLFIPCPMRLSRARYTLKAAVLGRPAGGTPIATQRHTELGQPYGSPNL